MGQIFSWIRGTRDQPALQDIAVEQQSQQVTPTTTSQVSTVKPAQYEKGATQSSTAAATLKPGAGDPATTQKGSSQVKPQATDSKSAPASSAKVPAVSSGTGVAGTTGGAGVKPADPVKDTPQSTTTSSSKPGPAKVDPAAGKPSGPVGAQKQTSAQKVQVEVGPSAAKVSTDVDDPFDALSGTLPSSQPLAPKVHYTGPEIKEPKLTSEKGVLCGERDDTLPPGYRKEDLEKKHGVPEKPKEVPKPISTNDALESLSSTFVSPAQAAPKKTDVKTETIGAVDVKSAGTTNFSPPPPSQQKQPGTYQAAAVTKSPAPPADKKAKMETHAQPAKPKTESDSSISLDALDALSDTLGAPEPPKKLPELKPGQIVEEKDVTSKKGVRVGERDDTLPPQYRFKEEDLKKHPPPAKEPSLNTDDAMDILSGDFTTPTPAPVVKAPVPSAQDTKKPAAVPEKTKDVPKPRVDALSSDFVAPAHSAPKVSSAAPKTIPPGPPQTPDEDPFSALGDTLSAPEPPKKQPDLKPKDIVHEMDVTSKKGVRVGERDDTLPPQYRFKEENLMKYPPPPQKDPSLDATEALDILSGDFTTPSAPSAVCPASKSPAKSSDSALDALAGDFVASSASTVHSAVSGPPRSDRLLSEGTSSALDALSGTLADIKAAPEPTPVPPKTVVKEKTVIEERISKPGERDDSLPPDHRFTAEERKAFEEAKKKDVKPKQPSMDASAALDLLSSDFSDVPTVKPTVSDAKSFTPAPTPPTFKATGQVLDKLADNVLSNLTDPKAKDSKAKGKGAKPKSKPKKQAVEDSSATDLLSSKPSSDVVPSASTNAGKR
ncbi:calpastatin isoform X4 [Danio aesculapii]|uniref:calpastatin isoform X4 n=1 Tax=Danio aesculapii TaxID=1142201 RepID=UPI0024C07C3D|nr:calpastatin isoform X4 [Danio aesculapii]